MLAEGHLRAGANGRVWVDSNSLAHTIIAANAIINAEFMSDVDVRRMVKRLTERLGS